MNALAMATGSLPATRTGLGSMTYPPHTVAVSQARRYVHDAVAMSATPALAEDAALLVAELAVNAVLHARTDFDVTVDSTAGGVRVSVRDRSMSLPVMVAPSATAMSGRGLALVAALASRWGVSSSASAPKSVWFELSDEGADRDDSLDGTRSDGADRRADRRVSSRAACDGGESPGSALVQVLSIEGLLAQWSNSSSTTALNGGAGADAGGSSQRAEGVLIVLPPLDALDLLGAEEAMEDVLRELQLLLLSKTHQVGHATRVGYGTGREDLETGATHGSGHMAGHWAEQEAEVAYRLDRAARGFADVRGQVRVQVSRAVAAGQQCVALHLMLRPDAARPASAYAAAVEAAEELAARGGLLSVAGALGRHRAVRRAYLLEVVAAATSL